MPRHFDPILVLFDDREGTSFLLFDPRDRHVYEDIILHKDVHRLYDMFPIRSTISNIRDLCPPTGNLILHPASYHLHQTLHYPMRARLFAIDYFREHKCAHFAIILNLNAMPLRFEDEEWTRWIQKDESRQSSTSSPASSVSSVSSSFVLTVSLAE